ncbi:hypothetical protein D3C80_1839850 [compost metagenome]
MFDHGVGGLGVGVQGAEEPQGQGGRRDAAQGQPAGDLPVDVLVFAMHPHAAGFGDGGVEQVGTDGGGRADAEPEKDGGHQGAAADAGHADDKTYDEACNGKAERTYIHNL